MLTWVRVWKGKIADAGFLKESVLFTSISLEFRKNEKQHGRKMQMIHWEFMNCLARQQSQLDRLFGSIILTHLFLRQFGMMWINNLQDEQRQLSRHVINTDYWRGVNQKLKLL